MNDWKMSRMEAISASNRAPIKVQKKVVRVARGGCVTTYARGWIPKKRSFAVVGAFYSIFLLLPRGAGSICGNCGAFPSTGVWLYVTVRVTTSRTLTRLERVGFFSESQVLGETAE